MAGSDAGDVGSAGAGTRATCPGAASILKLNPTFSIDAPPVGTLLRIAGDDGVTQSGFPHVRSVAESVADSESESDSESEPDSEPESDPVLARIACGGHTFTRLRSGDPPDRRPTIIG
jgi:hypothetical protein